MEKVQADRANKPFWITAVLLYTAIVLADFIFPIGRRFASVLLGTAVFPYDAILNAGILEWGYRSLWSPERRIFAWTAGFPLEDSLALTENLIGWQLFYTPLRVLGVGTVAAYNVVLVASFLVSGLGAAALARHFGADRYGGWVAGLIYAFVPFHLVHALHLQTMAICWSPLVLLFLDRYLCLGRPGDAMGLGLAVLATALSAMYFAVFLALVLPLYVLLCFACGRHRPRGAVLGGLAVTGLGTALVLLPVLLPYLRFAAREGYRHSVSTLARFSMHPAGFVGVPAWQTAWAWTGLVRPAEDPAFPGLVALILAGLFIRRAAVDLELRRTGLVLGLFGLMCAVLSLGPVLMEIPLPGQIFTLLGGVRWPMRILFYSFLAGAVLCGLGLTATVARVRPGWRTAAAWVAILLLFVEYRPQRWYASGSIEVPAPLEMSDAYAFLAQEEDRGAIVEVPAADRAGYRTPALVRYVYGSAGHLRRIVAVHGSVRPPAVDRLQAAAERLPDEAARRLLVEQGVSRLVVHRMLSTPQQFEATLHRLDTANYSRLFTGQEATVYALRSP